MRPFDQVDIYIELGNIKTVCARADIFRAKIISVENKELTTIKLLHVDLLAIISELDKNK